MEQCKRCGRELAREDRLVMCDECGWQGGDRAICCVSCEQAVLLAVGIDIPEHVRLVHISAVSHILEEHDT